jgi:hypothetical protein
MSSRLVVVAFAGSLFASQQAMAAAKARGAASEAKREKQAKKACLSGDYQIGVSILADLFVETEDPVYLYNQGRCYEQNVRYIEAGERFREYLRKAHDITDKIRADVEKHIADCDAGAAKTQPRYAMENSPPAGPPPAAPPQTYLPPPIPPQAPGVATTANAPLASTSLRHPWQHTAKWIAAGAAVGFLGLGVVEHLRYYTKNKDYNDDPKCGIGGQCSDLASVADTAQVVAIIGYGAAAVATGLAITFWLTDSPKTAPSAGIAIMCSPALGGATCSGRF